MQACRFENFHVTPENRAAYDRCLRVANLEPGAANPLVLIGGAGQGKTHLLWSIVHRVREEHPHTALVLVTAREFPERVKQLARDPEPIRRARHAILLVDSLAQFRHDAGELEAVVDLFLQHRFAVVIATSILPIQIEAFSPEFRRRLTAADMVTLAGRATMAHGPAPQRQLPIAPQRDTPRLAELEARLQLMQGEKEAMTAKLERSQRRVVQLEEEIAALLQKYTALEGSERQGRDASRELVRTQGELEAARVEALTAMEERDSARDTARRLEADNEKLRAEMQHTAAVVKAELEAELESARMMAAHSAQEAEEHQARAQRESEAAETAGRQMRQLAQHALGILDYLTAQLPEAADAGHPAQARMAEFIETLRQSPEAAAESLPLRLEQMVSGEESAAQRALRAQLAEAATEREIQAGLYEEARAAQARIDVELGTATARLRSLAKQRDHACSTQAILLAELDGLRQQTREEITQAQARIARMRWQASALAEQITTHACHDTHQIAEAIAALAHEAERDVRDAGPGGHGPLPHSGGAGGKGGGEVSPALESEELFPQAEKGRALLAEIARQMDVAGAGAGEMRGDGDARGEGEEGDGGMEGKGPLTRAVEGELG